MKSINSRKLSLHILVNFYHSFNFFHQKVVNFSENYENISNILELFKNIKNYAKLSEGVRLKCYRVRPLTQYLHAALLVGAD